MTPFMALLEVREVLIAMLVVVVVLLVGMFVVLGGLRARLLVRGITPLPGQLFKSQ